MLKQCKPRWCPASGRTSFSLLCHFARWQAKILLLEGNIIGLLVTWALESIVQDARHFKFKWRSQHYGRNSDINTKQLQYSPSFFPLLVPPKAKTEKNKCIKLRAFTFPQEKRIKERHFSVTWSPKSLEEAFEEDCSWKVKSFFTEQ